MWKYEFKRMTANEHPVLNGNYVLDICTDEKGPLSSLSEVFKDVEANHPERFEEILKLRRRIVVEIDQAVTENTVVEIANAFHVLDTKSRNARLKDLQNAFNFDPNAMAGAYAMRPYSGLILKKDKDGKLPFVAAGEFPLLWSTLLLDCRGANIEKSVMALASIIGRDDVRFVSLYVDKSQEEIKKLGTENSGSAWSIIQKHIEAHPATTYANSNEVDAEKSLDFICL